MTRLLARRLQQYVFTAVLMGMAAQSYAGKANDTLVYASDSEIENVSPYHNTMREGVILAHLVWSNLVYRDPKTGEYKPELATDWQWESPTALLMHLRQGVVESVKVV